MATLRASEPASEGATLRAPFIINEPNSEKADKTGLKEGELIVANAERAIRLGKIQKYLKEKLDENIVPTITNFKNWAGTQNSLLLYVKPTTRNQVQELVKAVVEMNRNTDRGFQYTLKIGMGGSYHSWSPTFPSPDDGNDEEGLLINICDLRIDDSGDKTREGYGRIILTTSGDKKTVTISSGVTNGELMSFFLKNKTVCFESGIILPTVTYGGILSGGCHGTGKDQQSMSDLITSIKFVDGSNGGLVTVTSESLTREDESGHQSSYILPNGVSVNDVMRAAQVNLGLFGVVVEYTMVVKEMTKAMVENDFDTSLQTILTVEGLGGILKGSSTVEIFWFPFNFLLTWLTGMIPGGDNQGSSVTAIPEGLEELKFPPQFELSQEWPKIDLPTVYDDKLWIRKITLEGDDTSPDSEKKKRKWEITQEPGLPFWSKLTDVIVQTVGNYVLTPLLQYMPKLTPTILGFSFQAMKEQYGKLQKCEVVRAPWAIHFRDGVDLMPCYDMEFAFPINLETPTKAVKAINWVVSVTTWYALSGLFSPDGKKPQFPLTLCMEMRVIKKSDTLLCPASLGTDEEGHVAYIEVLSMLETPGYEHYFRDIARGWMIIGGVPHWHKQWEFLERDWPNKKEWQEKLQGQLPLNIFHYIREKYGDRINDFETVRKLFDPNKLFMNQTMAGIFK